ncbi:MAG: FAD-dependent oxidoreductase [Pseudomonadota bacterium]
MGKHTPRMARREFLAALGAEAGGAAMLRVMSALGIATPLAACSSSSADTATTAPPAAPAPTPVGRFSTARPGDWDANAGVGRTVVILGAGIAGMTAAYEMQRLGFDCTVLEAQAAAGGRVKTLRRGDVVTEAGATQTCQFDAGDSLYFNAGPSRIAQHHELLLGYCSEFGVALETFTNANHGAWLHSPASFGGEPQVARRLIADTRGNIARLLATAINQNALDQELTAADRSAIVQLLGQFGDLGQDSGYGGSARAGFPGQMDAGSRRRGESLSPRQLQRLATDVFWELRLSFSQGFEQQPTMLQPVGGMDRIASAFEARVQNDLRYEATVTEIRKTAAGVRVAYTDRFGAPAAVEADFCIVTIPASVLRGIASDFSAGHQAEIDTFNYTAAVRVAFQSRRFWEQDHNIYGGISWTNQEITQVWYPNYGFGSDSGIVLGAYIFDGPAGTRFSDLSPAQRIDATLAQASALHPQFQGEALHGIGVAWRNMPFALGGWGTSSPGVLLTPDDRIVFAGEHLSILQGWQEGAILSAYQAIDTIVQLG